MAGPQVIVGQERPKEYVSRVDPTLGWGAVRMLAAAFILIGLADISIAFYQPRFDDKSWVFGVLASVIGGLPILSLGLTGGLVAAITLRSRSWTLVLGTLNAVLAVLIVFGLVMFGGAIEEARRNSPVAMHTGIDRSVLRTFMLGALFLLLHVIATVAALRSRVSESPHT